MCLFRCRFYTAVGDGRASGRCTVDRCTVEMLFNSKTRLPKVPSADEFFGVTNLEVKLLYPIVPLIGIPVGDFRGMHEEFVPQPRVFTHQTGTASKLWCLSDGFRQRF